MNIEKTEVKPQEGKGALEKILIDKMSVKDAIISGAIVALSATISSMVQSVLNGIKNRIVNEMHLVISIQEFLSSEMYEKTRAWLLYQKRFMCKDSEVEKIARRNNVETHEDGSYRLYKIKNHVCIVEIIKDDKTEYKTIRIKFLFTKNATILKEILDEIKGIDLDREKDTDRVKVQMGWTYFYKNKRSMDTIAIPKKDKKFIIDDLTWFMKSKKTYIDKGINYKRNYMFYGEPGCGKSSFIWALASHFNYDIKVIDISTVDSMSSLQSKLDCNRNTFVVFEDVDAMGANIGVRESSEKCEEEVTESGNKKEHISMSSLLNVFDGLNTPDNCICFFTTNHLNKLDPAFLRDGRMDIKLEIGKVGKREMIDNIAKNFLSRDKVAILEKELPLKKKVNPAKMQTVIMTGDVDRIIKSFKGNK